MTEEGIDAPARVLLDGLLRAVGPSSYERPAAEVWRAAAAEFAEVRQDRLGSSFATVNAGGGPRVALVGHIDEIGLVVKHVDSSGVLFVGEIGGWDPAVLVGQRVTVRTASGLIPGVVGKAARHLLSEDERSRVPKVHDLWVDIGASDEADAASTVQIGDPSERRGRRLASRALDNRLGALVVLEAARRAAAAGDLQAEVVAVASVREETSYTGARTAAYAIDPDIAITLDVTHTDDYPNRH